MTQRVPNYGENVKSCGKCRYATRFIGWEQLIRIRDDVPSFDHIHVEKGKLAAFNAQKRYPHIGPDNTCKGCGEYWPCGCAGKVTTI